MAARDRTEWVSTPSSALPADDDYDDYDADQGHERVGPYRLIEEIGEGGMGVVHLAVDPRGRAVAVKVLRAHVAHDADARKRLAREVETLSRVRDDRVASVIDADVMGPRPYIVTRYVPGAALDETVDEHGPLDPEELLRLARGTAEAIRSIHACGVVHRDIKPGNVLLEDGEPVLIDFGIAHLQDDVRHTVGGLVMGTPGYLSPELVEGAAITDATDWWGWAATITYAASGRPPFGRGRMDVVLSRVRAGEVDLAGVDPRLVPLLRASLSPNPAERPHAYEVLDALERYAAGQPATVPTPSGGPWDPHAETPAGATQVFPDRSTSVLPAQPAPVTDPFIGYAHQLAGSGAAARTGRAAAGAATAPPTGQPMPAYGGAVPVWGPDNERPPSGPPVTYEPEPHRSSYDGDGYGGDSYDGYDTWDDDEQYAPEREGDPRIGMAMRSGILAGLAAGWVAMLAAWPGVAVVTLVVWSSVARAIDRSVTGLVLRRYDHGRRRSDLPLAVVMTPWHLVVGAIATAVGLLLPLAVALAGVFSTALLVAGGRGDAVAPGTPLTLAIGGVLGVTTAWWGPGGTSLRRGSRSVVRRCVPEGVVTQVVAGVLVAGAAVVLFIALGRGESFAWSPFPSNPFGG